MKPAFVSVIGYGRSASMICAEHGIVRIHARTEPAQADARQHNADHHPEQETR